MKYMLLIYSDGQPSISAEREQSYEDSTQLAIQPKTNGQYLAANPLQSAPTATSVRVRDRRWLVTDGPFAETREQLG
jgi:hypothetical protein